MVRMVDGESGSREGEGRDQTLQMITTTSYDVRDRLGKKGMYGALPMLMIVGIFSLSLVSKAAVNCVNVLE